MKNPKLPWRFSQLFLNIFYIGQDKEEIRITLQWTRHLAALLSLTSQSHWAAPAAFLSSGVDVVTAVSVAHYSPKYNSNETQRGEWRAMVCSAPALKTAYFCCCCLLSASPGPVATDGGAVESAVKQSSINNSRRRTRTTLTSWVPVRIRCVCCMWLSFCRSRQPPPPALREAGNFEAVFLPQLRWALRRHHRVIAKNSEVEKKIGQFFKVEDGGPPCPTQLTNSPPLFKVWYWTEKSGSEFWEKPVKCEKISNWLLSEECPKWPWLWPRAVKHPPTWRTTTSLSSQFCRKRSLTLLPS